MPLLASNIARRDTKTRKGSNAFVRYDFAEYSRFCDKTISQYCTWYSYEQEALYDYASNNDWSIRHYHEVKRPDLFFSFVPFDLDSDDISISFHNAYRLVEWLEGNGIGPERFTIWLSGSKGFHVEVSANAFDVSVPSNDVLRRLKQFVDRLVKQGVLDKEVIDASLYSAARLYRCWGTKHSKTGLFKTPIKREQFTLEYVAARELWAAAPSGYEPEYPSDPPAKPIPLPLEEVEREFIMASGLVVDSSLSIIAKCPAIQRIMQDPSGREMRRQAVGVLTDAYGSPYSAEIERLYGAWREHPYMESRMEDAEKWLAEYEIDGTLKCKKTCSAMGCNKVQKRTCGTEVPSDHLVKMDPIETISFEEARVISDGRKSCAVYAQDSSAYVFDEPIGFGKTTSFIRMLAADESLSALYLCPTHNLANQVVGDMQALGIRVRHLKSRDRMVVDEELECPFIEEINAVATNGMGNTTKAVCSKCPRFPANKGEDPCEYYGQYDGLEGVRVVVGMHHHANSYVYEKCGLEDRSFLLVDENPIEAFSGEVREVPTDIRAVLYSYGPMALAALQEPPKPHQPIEAKRGIFGAARAVAEATELAMKDKEYSEERRAIDNYTWDCIALLLHGSPLPNKNLELLDDLGYYPAWVKFLNKLIELSAYGPAVKLKQGYQHLAFPDIIASALVVKRIGLVYDMAESYYYPRRLPEKKVIVLDATADEGLYRQMVKASDDRDVIYHRLPYIEQTKATIIQVTNSGYSKSRIESDEDTLERLTFVARSLRSTFEEANILCVVPLQLKKRVESLIDSSKTKVDHYGNLRGRNEYKNFDYQVVLGGFFIPNKAVVSYLAKVGVFGITEEMLESSAIVLRAKHVAKNGSSYFSQRKAFRTSGRADCPFHLANLILINRAKAEVVQSIRVRLYHGTDEKVVYVLTNIGLTGIYADQFLSLDNLTLGLEELSGMKDELLNEGSRESALLEARFFRIAKGGTFGVDELGKDPSRSYKFLKYLVDSGYVKKVAAGSYAKIADIGEVGVVVKAKESKAVVFAKLDAWFKGLPNGENFGAKEISNAGNTQSIAYIRAWVMAKLDGKEINKSGSTSGVRYHKVKRVFTGLVK